MLLLVGDFGAIACPAFLQGSVITGGLDGRFDDGLGLPAHGASGAAIRGLCPKSSLRGFV